MRSPFNQSGGFEGELSPEDLFNMFFGGGGAFNGGFGPGVQFGGGFGGGPTSKRSHLPSSLHLPGGE